MYTQHTRRIHNTCQPVDRFPDEHNATRFPVRNGSGAENFVLLYSALFERLEPFVSAGTKLVEIKNTERTMRIDRKSL